MLILALDTSVSACSVALYDTDAARAVVLISEAMDKGHAEALVPMVARCLETAGMNVRDCGLVATTIGPGSFTGLRVGISAARGFSLAVGCGCVGIDTLKALAEPTSDDAETAIASCIDARHGHVFFALYQAGRLLVAPVLLGLDEAATLCANQPCRLVGSGAGAVADHWPDGISPPVAVDPRQAPDILAVARLAAKADPARSPARPLYLRAPDAKPSTQQAMARQ